MKKEKAKLLWEKEEKEEEEAKKAEVVSKSCLSK